MRVAQLSSWMEMRVLPAANVLWVRSVKAMNKCWAWTNVLWSGAFDRPIHDELDLVMLVQMLICAMHFCVSYEPWYCLDARRVHRLMREERDCTILVLPVCFVWRIQARPMHLELPKQIAHNIRGRLVSCYKCHMVIAGRTVQLFEMGLGHATILHVETLLHSFFSRFYLLF